MKIGTNFSPQIFINTCGEILKSIQEQVYFNLGTVISLLIILIVSIGVSLALFQLVRFIISNQRLRQLKHAQIIPNKLQRIINKHNLQKKVILAAEDSTSTAFTMGLFRSRIVISQSLVKKLTTRQLEAVILHESYHLHSGHVLWLFIFQLINSLFFFIPLIRYLTQQLKTGFELAADAFVVEKQKTKNYLCDSLALNLQSRDNFVSNFATSPIEKRVEFLINNQVPNEKISTNNLIISLFSLTLMLGIAFIQPDQISANFDHTIGKVCISISSSSSASVPFSSSY